MIGSGAVCRSSSLFWAILFTSAVFFGGATAVQAQQAGVPQIEVSPDRTRVALNDPFWVRVTVSSSEGGASVSLPAGSPFEIVRRGGTSTSISFTSGLGQGSQVSRRETTRWQVRAIRMGRHTLGPLVITVGGRQFTGGTASIEVVAAGTATPPPAQQQQNPFPGFPNDPFSGFPQPPRPQPQPQPQQPGQGQLPGQLDPADLTGAQYDQEMFLRTVIEPSEAYVGQQVIATIFLYTAVQLSNVNVTREASTDGFWSEDLLGPTRRLQFADQFVGSTRFRVAMLRKVALFPLREGILSVGGAHIESTQAFGSPFNRRMQTIVRQGTPVQLQVKGLPEAGRPAGFRSGNVGRYSITSRVDKRQVKVGEPVTLAFTVRGEGHLKNVKLDPLGEIEGTRIYEPTIENSVTKSGGKLGGSRRWEYLILPQKSGTLELPSVEWVYFDPRGERYETRRTKAIKIQVTGEDRAPSPLDVDDDGDRAPTDEELAPLRSIHRQSRLRTETTQLYSQWWFLLALAFAPAGFLALVVVDRLRRRRAATRDVVRSRKAAQVAQKLLNEVKEGKVGGADGLNQVMRALNGFFVDRLGEPISGLTHKELRDFLTDRGVTEEMADKVVAITEKSEQARYGGGGDDRLTSGLAVEAGEMIHKLDAVDMKAVSS